MRYVIRNRDEQEEFTPYFEEGDKIEFIQFGRKLLVRVESNEETAEPIEDPGL